MLVGVRRRRHERDVALQAVLRLRNAGIVVQTEDEDFDAMGGQALLRGRELQRRVEAAAFAAAGGTYAAPALRVTDS